jgi:hypothetical protein
MARWVDFAWQRSKKWHRKKRREYFEILGRKKKTVKSLVTFKNNYNCCCATVLLRTGTLREKEGRKEREKERKRERERESESRKFFPVNSCNDNYNCHVLVASLSCPWMPTSTAKCMT